MHSLAFIRIFNVAFGTKCIHVHFYASYVGCIFIACCIHMHPMHKMHSCAFLVCCILSMSHCNAFWCILSLMHFRMCCCIWCTWYIHVHYRMYMHSERDAFPRILMHTNALHSNEQAAGMRMHKNAYECIRMHMNTYECIRMHTNAWESIHEWATMHESWSWASPLGGLHSPWMRVWVNAFECAWMRKNASASECNVSTECTLCVEAYKCI